MRITFDPSKRERTLAERGLDFAQAATVFDGDHLTFEDDRQDYGELRLITIGRLTDRMGGSGLDAARRGAPRHFDEEGQ
ncbi:MAG: BrnT family toxin [Brevundimonas sp.]